jgi:hypothetical protein
MMDEEPVLAVVYAGFDDDELSEGTLPELVVLRCELVPNFNMCELQGTHFFNNKECSSCPLWDPLKKPLETITLCYAGSGRYLHGSLHGAEWVEFSGHRLCQYTLFSPKITSEKPSSRKDLYTKSFLTLRENVILSAHLKQDGMVCAPSLDPSCKPFWGYGGSFYPQILLSDIIQYYLTLDNDGSKTIVQSHSHKSFLAKGIHPVAGDIFNMKSLGKIAFMKESHVKSAHYQQSLEDDIVNGLVQFFIKDHLGQSYASIQAKQLGRSRFVDVTFKKEE